MRRHRGDSPSGFSLVEVVLAMGIVSFSVLATVALLSVGNDTSKKSRDEAFAARIAANEFEQLRSFGAARFADTIAGDYDEFFDSNLAEVPATQKANAVYQLRIAFVNPAPSGAADILVNAEVRYPANAPEANQGVYHYTSLMNSPKP